MKIRLTGLPEEIEQVTTRLRDVLDVLEVSAPYPCRGESRQVRVYLEVRP
ncbi:hypothetical protein ACWDA3_51210 [Nonomuraea rubra]